MNVFRSENHAQSLGFTMKSNVFQVSEKLKIDAKRDVENCHFRFIFGTGGVLGRLIRFLLFVILVDVGKNVFLIGKQATTKHDNNDP